MQHEENYLHRQNRKSKFERLKIYSWVGLFCGDLLAIDSYHPLRIYEASILVAVATAFVWLPASLLLHYRIFKPGGKRRGDRNIPYISFCFICINMMLAVLGMVYFTNGYFDRSTPQMSFASIYGVNYSSGHGHARYYCIVLPVTAPWFGLFGQTKGDIGLDLSEHVPISKSEYNSFDPNASRVALWVKPGFLRIPWKYDAAFEIAEHPVGHK